MQTTLSTSPDGATPLREALERVGPPALLAGLLLASAALILPHLREPIFDQGIFLKAAFSADRMPSPEKGLTSELWVATLRLFWDAPLAELNAAVKGLAMAFYTIAATCLASAWLRRREAVALFVLLLFASQLPYLWISVEVFAGAYLCLALLAWKRGAPPWLLGGLLAFLALAKPDLILIAGVLAAFWAWRARGRDGSVLLGSCAGVYALLVLPGLLLHGTGYYQTWGPEGEGRAFISFADHFKRVLYHFQVSGTPPVPLAEYTRPFFGDAKTMWQVVTHPQGWFVYLEFVVLGALRGAVKMGYLLNWLLLAVPLLVWARRRGGLGLSDDERSLLLCFVGFVPLLLLSYPHIRYMARFWPVILLLLLGSAERIAALEDTRLRRPALALSGAFLVLALGTLGSRALYNLQHVAAFEHYWFPD